ncbi:MAG: type III pantothenate kinase [Nitrospinota bacterium]|nr:type III pantothenate kinase [Nitrospinota bacterium]
MLLAIDIGNTNTVIGVFDGENLKYKFRLSTNHFDTSDEISFKLSGLLEQKNVPANKLSSIIICSVVPHLTGHYIELSRSGFKLTPLIVGPGIKTGISILYDNPREVGADRVANAVGGFKLFGGPLIVVDLGTAITFDAVSAKGDYMGGAIAPGIETSMSSLVKKAAQLTEVSLFRPDKVIGKNTIESMQSGSAYGFAGLVDAIVNRMKSEIGGNPKTIATGGHCVWIQGLCETVDDVSPDLTLWGLYYIYLQNK